MNKFENQFQKKMEEHLIKFKVERQYLPSNSKKKWLYNDIADNLFPPIRHGFLQYIYDEAMPLHDYINHVRSSQAYCVNILYSVLTLNPNSLLKLLGHKINKVLKTVTNFQFEHSPEKNELGEWKSDTNKPEEYVTAIDLRIDTIDSLNKRIVFLIEVKFTEPSFSQCGGFNSGGNVNETRNACEDGKELFKNFNLCYLHGSDGKSKLKRTYFNYFPPLSKYFCEPAFSNECPFIQTHQCLRIHALARSIEDESYFVLLHHEKNEAIRQEWKKYVSILQPEFRTQLLTLTGMEVVDHSEIDTLQAYYRDRYTLSGDK